MLRTYSGLKTFFLGVIASCNAGCTMAAGYISRLPLMPNGLNSIAGAIALPGAPLWPQYTGALLADLLSQLPTI